jgi:twitching motility two-component system response regulator PilH
MGLFDFFRRTLTSPTAPGGPATDGPPPGAGRGPKVLIIDDSTTVVILLRRMLEQEGYAPIEALNAEEGIKLAVEEQPKLIFLDIVLPGMNGFAALRNLRRNAKTQTIPIIMMSGNEQATEQFWAEKIGADDFMKKPFSRAEVLTRVERLARKPA